MKKLFAVLLAVMMMASLLSFASADGYTIRIYSNSNSTERTTWLIEKAKEAGALVPKFICRDILDDSKDYAELGTFDLILSNPPYIMEKEKGLLRKNVKDYEPANALFVPDENPLLYYRAIATIANRCLAPQGKGIVEINECLGKETEALFKETGYPLTEVVKDFYEKNRFILFEK